MPPSVVGLAETCRNRELRMHFNRGGWPALLELRERATTFQHCAPAIRITKPVRASAKAYACHVPRETIHGWPHSLPGGVRLSSARAGAEEVAPGVEIASSSPAIMLPVTIAAFTIEFPEHVAPERRQYCLDQLSSTGASVEQQSERE